MSFAENLKAARRNRNISQEILAERLDVSRQAVSKWEQGMGYPEVETLIMLAKELQVSLDDLMDHEVKGSDTKARGALSTGKILVRAQDGKTLASCYKFVSSPVIKGKRVPQYALYGVDGQSFLDENRIFLGWYADEKAITREISEIQAALGRGEATYGLQYAARVKKRFWSIELVD